MGTEYRVDWVRWMPSIPVYSVDIPSDVDGQPIADWLKENGTGFVEDRYINEKRAFRYYFSDPNTATLFKLRWVG